jgi:transcription elongation GreA/GreB family factor
MKEIMDANQAKADANLKEVMIRIDANQTKVDANMKTNQEMLTKMEARIEENNEKFEVLQGILVSRIDANQVEMRSTVSAIEENLMSAMHSIQSSDFESVGDKR